jgi:hypothetical protein
VGLEHFTYLLDILKKFHGVQYNMAGNKFAGMDIEWNYLLAAAASVCQDIYLCCFSNTSIHNPPNHGYLHINVSLLPTVPSLTSHLIQTPWNSLMLTVLPHSRNCGVTALLCTSDG